MKHRLSHDKQAEREALRQERREAQRAAQACKKEEMNCVLCWVGFAFLVLIVGICIAIIQVQWLPTFVVIVLGIVIFFLDNSGIRTEICAFLPQKPPFTILLHRKNAEGNRGIALIKTIAATALLLLIFTSTMTLLWLSLCIAACLILIGYILLQGSEMPRAVSNTGITLFLINYTLFLRYTRNITHDFLLLCISIGIGLLLTSLYFLHFRRTCSQKSDFPLLFIVAVTLPYSLFCTVNKAFDFSKPATYQTVVVSKDTERTYRGSTMRYLYVVNWHGTSEQISVDVSSEIYRSVVDGDCVIIAEYEGLLGLSYYCCTGKAKE